MLYLLKMVNNIYHIADLHIRADRRREYLPVFNNLIAYLQTNATKDDVVIICGDIFHFMTRYQGPDDITDFCTLINGITNICPLIIIPGNHDINMNNKAHGDLITPIYEIIKQYKDNIYYYNKTGIYRYDDISFAVLGVTDNVAPSVLIEEVRAVTDAAHKIALVHEDINGATFGEFVIKDARVDNDFLRAFDYVLAGHIHDTQFIQVPDSAVKVAYCGALFQQNIGESLSKGLIKWNLRDKTHEFVRIPSEYGAIKLVIEDNVLREIPAELFPKVIKDVLIEYKNSRPEFIKSVVEDFSARHNFLIKRIIDKTPAKQETTAASKSTYNKSELIHDNLSQEEVIKSFLQDKNIKLESIEDVLTAHRSYNKAAEQALKLGNKRWRILSMEWSNLFCYGENNHIDFTKVPESGLLGIIANNRAGKSSVIDILIYGLFNKLRRGDVKHVARLGSKYYYLKLALEIDGIQATIIRQCNGAWGANATAYFSINGDNKTRESITLTYQDVGKYIGTYDDFIRTNIMCQDNTDDFVKLSSVNRRKFLIKFFQLDTWVDIEAQVRKDILDITKEINNSVPQSHTIESMESNYLPGIKSECNKLTSNINEITTTQTNHHAEIAKLQSAKDELLKGYDNSVRMTPAEYTSARNTRDTLLKKKPVQTIDELNELLQKKMSEKRNIRGGDDAQDIDIDNIKAEYQSILDEMKRYDGARGDIAEVNSVLKELNAERVALQHKIKTLTIDTSPLQKIAVSLKSIYEARVHFADHIKYADSCADCTSNKALVESLLAEIQLQESKANKITNITNIKDNEVEIAELQRKLAAVVDEEREVNELLNNLIKKQKVRERYIKVRDIITNFDDIAHNAQVTKHVEYIKKVIEHVKLLDEVEKKIAIYDANQEITARVRTINAAIADHNAELARLYNEHVKLSKSYGEMEKKIEEAEGVLERLKRKSAHRDTLRLYLTCLDSKTGIPFKILSNVFVTLERRVNNLLNRITDFNLSFINDEDGKKEAELRVCIVGSIDTNVSRGGGTSADDKTKSIALPLELGSGFQQFIVSIVLRISLAQMFPAQLSDFFIIDEGFSCMDAANIGNAQQFLLHVKQYFRFVLIISHLDVLQNMIEYPITIDTNEGISNIKNIDTPIQHEMLKAEKQSKLVKKDDAGDITDQVRDMREQPVHELQGQQVEPAPRIIKTIDDAADDKKKDIIVCEYCKVDVARSYYARHVKTKKHEQAVAMAKK